MDSIRIGLVGDYQPTLRPHVAIPRALSLASDSHFEIDHVWLPTRALKFDHRRLLEECDGIWCTPGSPYESMEGALLAIRFAREHRYPFLGTCSGFQHAIIEYARNVLGMTQVDHAESNPSSAHPIIHRLPEPLVSKRAEVNIVPGTKLHTLYGADDAVEDYNCRFGCNPAYTHIFEDGELMVSAIAPDGTPHGIELTTHPFFMAVLYLPALQALSGKIHPIFKGYLSACLRRRKNERSANSL